MTTALLASKKYESKVSEDIEEAHFKPMGISASDFYYAVLSNHEESKDIIHLSHHENDYIHIKNATYIHPSGAAVIINGIIRDDLKSPVVIIGTEKAIEDTQTSLELLTQRRLEEVRRELLIEAY